MCTFVQEEANRGKPNWEHLNDELHVLITVEDTPNRATVKIARAIEEVQKLLVPVVSSAQESAWTVEVVIVYLFLQTEGEDELKKRQLMELAIINGTYRDSSVRNGAPLQYYYYAEHPKNSKIYFSETENTARLMTSPISMQQLARAHNQQTMGAPLIISPARHLMHQSHLLNGSGPPPLIPAENGMLYAPFEAFHQHYLANPNLLAECYPPTSSHGTPGSESLSGSGQLITSYVR